MISVTDNAVKHLRTLINEHADTRHTGLRIFVEAGGCAGMQYGMKLDHWREGDAVIEKDGVHVIVDGASAGYLKGCEIDFTDELAGAGFRIRNPNAVRSCGCGTSFEVDKQRDAAH